jgi:hypothetical protein
MQKRFDTNCGSEETFFNDEAIILVDKTSAIFDQV